MRTDATRPPDRDGAGASWGAARGAAGWLVSAGDDVELDGRLHLGVEAHQRGVRAGGLDRGRDLDLALVERRTARGLDGIRDVTGGDGAEQAAAGAGVRGDRDGLGLEVALDGLRLFERLHLADLTALGDGVDLLLAALGPRRRETATEEEVAGVAVLDVDDVTGGAEAGDLVGEDDLHRYGSFSNRSAGRARVRQQGHLARVLDGIGDRKSTRL